MTPYIAKNIYVQKEITEQQTKIKVIYLFSMNNSTLLDFNLSVMIS